MIELDWVYLAVAAMAWVVTLAGVAAWAYDRGVDAGRKDMDVMYDPRDINSW